MKQTNDSVLNYEAGADLKCFFCGEDMHPGDFTTLPVIGFLLIPSIKIKLKDYG